MLTRAGVRPARMPDRTAMGAALNSLVPFAIGSVAVVLLLGLANMVRGGSPNTSQTLMRWRVILQFVAIVIIMAAIWFKSR